ncbi:MAG: tetratricopeptide repeat protein [Candidatus Omnitrophica bacterium]|nr:tetratricopeptide repeat protein [Candidatus Omnitrophota bacterium]MDD5437374.1 tetratricopeptide repeat protein [Candidatus Omnitrophota bacterium]
MRIGIAAVTVLTCIVGMQAAPLFAAPLIYKDVERRIRAGEFDNAESLLNAYLSSSDKDVTALSMLGRLYQDTGNKKKAAQFLKKAVKIDPGYPPAHFFLGKNYYKEMKDDEAVSEFAVFRSRMEQMSSLDEEEKAFYIDALDEISEIYFNLKMFDDFYAVNQRILEISPKDQAAVYNMGVYYYLCARNNSKAYQLFNKVIALAPDSDLAKKATYTIEFMRANPDPRMAPDLDFIDKL